MVLLWGKTVHGSKIVEDKLCDYASDFCDLLFKSLLWHRGKFDGTCRCSHFAGRFHSREHTDLLENAGNHDVDALHVGGSDYVKCVLRAIGCHGGKHQVL